jgi:hypothetical protein
LNESTNVSSGFSRTESSDSDDGSDNHDVSTTKHHLSSTESFTDKVGDKGTKETTDFVTGSNGTSNGTGVNIIRGGLSRSGELVVESLGTNDTRHKT